MQLGVIGLGRMGANIVRRLTRAGHACVVYDRDPGAGQGAGGGRRDAGRIARGDGRRARRAARGLDHAAGRRADRIDDRVAAAAALARATAIIDGGNSLLARRRAARQVARRRGPRTISTSAPAAASGGSSAAICLMIGGRRETVERLDPIFKTLAPGRGDDPADAGPRRRATRASRKAICTPARAAPAISSRWSTTASNTA